LTCENPLRLDVTTRVERGLAAAVTAAAAEVEDTYAVDVRPVALGDRPPSGFWRPVQFRVPSTGGLVHEYVRVA
jgi:hypothetical protein